MKKNNKLRLASACLLVMSLAPKLHAQEQLVLEMKDHSKATFVLADKPKLSISEATLVAKDSKNNTKEIALSDLVRYYFSTEQTPTGIHTATTGKVRPSLANGHVYYEGLQEATLVRVIALGGQEIARYKVSGDGRADIDLTRLAKGVYLIQAGKNTIKISNQ